MSLLSYNLYTHLLTSNQVLVNLTNMKGIGKYSNLIEKIISLSIAQNMGSVPLLLVEKIIHLTITQKYGKCPCIILGSVPVLFI